MYSRYLPRRNVALKFFSQNIALNIDWIAPIIDVCFLHATCDTMFASEIQQNSDRALHRDEWDDANVSEIV